MGKPQHRKPGLEKPSEANKPRNRRGSLTEDFVSQHNEIIAKTCVCIVVLGDIGRSPRMRYHAKSFAQEDFYVHIIGHNISPLPSDLIDHPNVWVNSISEPPKMLQVLPKLLVYPAKILWHMVTLAFAFAWMVLRYRFRPDCILVQNPPAVPTLAMCWIYSKILNCTFMIDWHNYAFSLMGLTLGKSHIIVRFAKWFEDFFGAKADKHICVTRGMKDDLHSRLNINPSVLYDRPPDKFQRLESSERQLFLQKLSKKYPEVVDLLGEEKSRAGLLISSTSWTEDEDFSILLSALQAYDKEYSNRAIYRKLIVFITGKGPLKEFYKQKIEAMNFSHVCIVMPWLENEEYPKLLGCADLGVSLHTSSSGLDLPMKVVDMFGCCLPVCALNFPSIPELVKHEENSLIFNVETELARQIQEWFRTDVKNKSVTFREKLQDFQRLRWHENWMTVVHPLVCKTKCE